jgi:hypothetical protein
MADLYFAIVIATIKAAGILSKHAEAISTGTLIGISYSYANVGSVNQ